MNLVRLHTRGFMAYKNEMTIKFGPGLTYILGENLDNPDHADSNGAAKTTVFYAICWLLWGKIPAEHNKNDLVHWDAPGAYGELELASDSEFLKIVRTKPRAGSEKLSFNYCGQAFELDMPHAQNKLESFYGISWETFVNSIFISPESKATQFVQATPAKRAQILAELIDDEVFQIAAKEIGNDITKHEQQIRVNESILSRIDSDMVRLQTDILRTEAQITQEAQVQQEQAQKDQKAVLALMEEQALLQRSLNTPKESASITELQIEKNGISEQIQRQLFELGRLRNIEGGRSFQAGEECPTCRQQVGPEHVHRLQSVRSEATIQAQHVLDAVTAMQARVKEIDSLIVTAQNVHLKRQHDEKRVKDLQAQIVSLRSKGEMRTAVDALIAEKSKMSKRYQEYIAERKENEESTAALRGKLPALKILKAGFQTEIRDMMFDDLRQVLSFYTDKYRWLLAGGEFEIEFPVERGKFDILIKTAGQKNTLTSRGETWRATFAVLLALKRALTYGNRTIFDFLMVDDPFVGGLDDTGIRVFSRLLESLKQEIPQTLVTLPRKVQDMAEGRTLLTRRQNRVSQLVGG